MKAKRLIVILVFLLLLSAHAYGASLSYSPDSISLVLRSGESQTAELTITLLEPPATKTYYLWFVSSTTGSIPIEWLYAEPSISFISRWRPSSTTRLTISVPDGTPPGTYSGYLFSKAMSAHVIDPGQGVRIEVVVPPSCSGAPEIEIASFSPEYIWPPNHRLDIVTVTGKISLPQGCSLGTLGWQIEDEYGLLTGSGGLDLDETGDFTAYIPVEASRYGSDKDGRRYVIKVFAEDEAGRYEKTLNAVVPHDQRRAVPSAE